VGQVARQTEATHDLLVRFAEHEALYEPVDLDALKKDGVV